MSGVYTQMHIHARMHSHYIGQGAIVESVEEATHIIYPPPPPSPSDEEYVRPLQVRGKTVLVHWWYYPDRWVLYIVHSCLCVCLSACVRVHFIITNYM